MPISLTSPNTDNYYVGKGILSVQFVGESGYVDMGNVTSLEFTPGVKKLEHFSSRIGTKRKDKVVVQSLEATLKIVAEEWTARNMQMALVADMLSSTGTVTLDIMTAPLRGCAIKFVGTNDIGPKWSLTFPICTLTPSAALGTITDEWGKIELTADCFADPVTGSFGTASATFP